MTERTFEVALPIPPSVNHCYVRRGKTYYKNGHKKKRMMNVLSKPAEEWMSQAKDLCMEALKDAHWMVTENEKVIVDIWVYWPDRRRRDAHNLLKLLCDALEGFVCVDDKMMLTRIIDFDFDKGHPRVEVKARMYDEA